MSSTASAPVIRLSALAASACDSDLLVVPLFDGEAASALQWVDPATDGEVGRAIESGEVRGRLYETFLTLVTSSGFRARRIVIIGAGKLADFDLERLRKVATAAALNVLVHSAVVTIPGVALQHAARFFSGISVKAAHNFCARGSGGATIDLARADMPARVAQSDAVPVLTPACWRGRSDRSRLSCWRMGC